MAAEHTPLEDILKMDDRELRDWHTARLYDIGNTLDHLPCRAGGDCPNPSRLRKVSIWSAIGVFAGSSVTGVVLGIMNWLGH
jgi:hypothetical protein